MLKKTIKYTDYNGVEREDAFWFHLTKAEIMEMEMGTKGGLTQMIRLLMETEDMPQIIKVFKDIILKAYGEKSIDGKRFIKENDAGVPLSRAFSQTEAYSVLFMELATDADAASKFIQGIVPSDIDVSDEKIKEIQENLNNN